MLIIIIIICANRRESVTETHTATSVDQLSVGGRLERFENLCIWTLRATWGAKCNGWLWSIFSFLDTSNIFPALNSTFRFKFPLVSYRVHFDTTVQMERLWRSRLPPFTRIQRCQVYWQGTQFSTCLLIFFSKKREMSLFLNRSSL